MIVNNRRNDGVHQHIDGPIRQAMRTVLPAEMTERVEEMVGRFSAEGQVALSSVLIHAHAKGKLEAALREVEREWQNHFCVQDSEIRGDPNFSDNLVRLARICGRLGVKPPWEKRR